MIRKVLFLMWLVTEIPVSAAQVTVINGGKLHMQGALVNSACSVASESQNMTVQMGQYRNTDFKDIGNYAPVSIPFVIRLNDCQTDVSHNVGITFQGMTPVEDPQVFLATTHMSGHDYSTGIGLALFDGAQQLIIPNSLPVFFLPLSTQEITFHFTARYRAVSERLTPGNIKTDVWFVLVYP